MTTPVEFLEALLPSQGLYYAGELIDPDKGWFKNLGFQDIASVQGQCKLWDNAQRHAYFALGSFEPPREVDGKFRKRAAALAIHFRAHWLDLDVGQGKAYGSQKQALVALNVFLKAYRLPKPTYLVSSGNGIHVYWAFEQDIPKASWQRVAVYLRALCERHGLGADHKCTANPAQVLRPLGTRNWKDPANPKPVRLLLEHAAHKYQTFVRAISEAVKAHGVKPAVKTASRPASKNAEFAANVYPPSSAARAAEKCPTLAAMRDTLGADQDEPLWYACLGVLAHCADGEELAHAWSQGHPGYDRGACQAKLEQRRGAAGPTLCDSFKVLSPACSGCSQTCKSPIQLGHLPPEHTPEVVAEFPFPEFPEEVKRDFVWANGWLKGRQVIDGEETWVSITPMLVWPEFIHRERATGTYVVRVHVRSPLGVRDYADIAMKEVAHGQTLVVALAARLGLHTDYPKLLVRFMQTWIQQIRNTQINQETVDAMGWQADGSFVLGETKYLPDGTRKLVAVHERLRPQVAHYTPAGSKRTYLDCIDTLYNRPNRLAHQVYWLVAFASPLLALVSDGNLGIPIVAYDPGGRAGRNSRVGGGVGKTTAAELGVAAWANPTGVGQKVGANNTTELALYTSAGMRHDLPILLDEVTSGDWTPEKLAKFAYSYSYGVAKMQAKAEGGLRDNSHLNWCNMMWLTTNESVLERLATIPDSAPQIMRTFEIRFPNIKDELDAGERVAQTMRRIQDVMRGHYGHLGPEYIQYVVKHREALAEKLGDTMEKLVAKTGVRQDARFWLRAAATLLTAFHITKKLGFHTFDTAEFVKYIVKLVNYHQAFVDTHADDYADIVRHMIKDLLTGMIVTEKAGTNKTMVPFAAGYGPPRGEITGRVVKEEATFYIPLATVKQWCLARRYKYAEMREALSKDGILTDVGSRIYLGKGTPVPAPRVAAWTLKFPELVNHLELVDENYVAS